MRTFILLLFVFAVSTANAQEDTIYFDKKSNKPFIVNNHAYFFKERNEIFKNEEALKLLNSAHSKIIGSQLLAGAGGGFLGFTLSDLLLAKRGNFTEEQWSNKKKIRTVFLASGVALIGIAIPVSKSAVRKVEEAVNLENNTIRTNVNQKKLLRFYVEMNGVGLAYQF